MKHKSADKTDELLKAWDDNGKYLGMFPRKQVHDKGLWHREAACIILSPKNHILCIKRSYEKSSYPGAWALVAGHVVGDESPIEATLLEGEEELNMPLFAERHNLNDDHRICSDMPNERDDNKALVTCYWMRPKALRPDMVMFQEEEVAGFQWLSLRDFKEMVKRQDSRESIFKDNKYYNTICDYLEKLLSNKKTSVIDGQFLKNYGKQEKTVASE